MFLGATVLCEATGEVGVTGGTPMLQVRPLLSAENKDKQYS